MATHIIQPVETAHGAAAGLSGASRQLLVYRVAGVVLPLLLVAAVAASKPLSFDGAMNMQVASNLATTGTYGRYFGGFEVFPSEIQTSSYFLFITAAAIAVFGASSVTFQFGNFVFLALLLGAVSWVSPRSRLLVLLMPGLLTFATPGLLTYSIGGYGEGAVAGLAVLAIAFTARAITGDGSVGRDAIAAGACVGVAISIKTVAVAVAPVVGIGLVVAALVRGTWLRTVGLGAIGAGVPFLVFETFRLISLGTDGYLGWWQYHFERINVQATGSGLEQGSQGVAAKTADHLHLLAVQTSVAAEWWLLFFVTLPIAVLLVTLAARRLGVLRAMARPLLVVAGLTCYGTLYVAWWLAVTSTEKAWLRRITIGLFVLMLAAALLSLLVARLLYRSPRPHGGLPLSVASITTAATTLALGVIVVQGLGASLDTLTSASRLSDVAEVSDEVADLSAEGADLYGIGWWSAPVVSLYSGVGMENLSQTDYCDPDTLAVIEAGEAYMVWDFYAENLASPTPNPYAEVVYERTSLGNDFATLWRITLPEGACD